MGGRGEQWLAVPAAALLATAPPPPATHTHPVPTSPANSHCRPSHRHRRVGRTPVTAVTRTGFEDGLS